MVKVHSSSPSLPSGTPVYSPLGKPPAIKAAILLLLGTLYDNESDQIVGRSVSELSLTAEKLLLPWRVTPYGNV